MPALPIATNQDTKIVQSYDFMANITANIA